MPMRLLRMTLIAASLLAAGGVVRAEQPVPPAAASQTASPEAMAAAKELISTIRLDEQFKAILPAIVQNLKPAVVQGRPEVERDYDLMAPKLIQGFHARIGELSETVTEIYASNFTADELRALIAFYKTPAGQKFLEKTPFITRQTMAAGQKFGASVGAAMAKEMTDELRAKGHKI